MRLLSSLIIASAVLLAVNGEVEKSSEPEQPYENIFLKSFFSTCTLCKIIKENAANRPPIEKAREEVFRICNAIPKKLFESCDHVGSLMMERFYDYISRFGADENACNNFCEDNSKALTMETSCEIVHYFYSKLDFILSQIMTDLTKLCATSPNPFSCVEIKLRRKPLLEGLLKRSFVKVADILLPGNICELDLETVPGSENMKAAMDAAKIQRGPAMADEAPPSKIVCDLCDTLMHFLQQIFTSETHVGAEIRQDMQNAVSDTCHDFINEDASACDTLAVAVIGLTDNVLARIKHGICDNSLHCDKLT